MTRPELLEYRRSKVLKGLFWILANFLSVLLLIFLYALLPFRRLKIFLFIDDKFGHLGPVTDLFLRRIGNGTIKINRSAHYIGIARRIPTNRQMFKMFERKMHGLFKDKIRIIRIPEPDLLQALLRAIFSEHSLFGKSQFFQPMAADTYYVPEFSTCRPAMSFTEEEENRGQELLKKMGIKKGAWFVCFLSRDSAYLKETSTSKHSTYYDYRNCDIKNYLKAAEYITSKGGYAVRVGSFVRKPLPKLKNPRIIDYSTNYRTDFCDIYLPAQCRFTLGASSGLTTVSTYFNKPVAEANVIPITHPNFRRGDVFIPKKLWSKKEKRFLTFKEMIDFQGDDYAYTSDFEDAGLLLIENTPDEILDLTKEMLARLNGKFKYTKEDLKLQKKFQSMFKSENAPYRHNIRICAKFLRDNKDLLG